MFFKHYSRRNSILKQLTCKIIVDNATHPSAGEATTRLLLIPPLVTSELN